MVDSRGAPVAKSAVLETKFYFPRWRPGQVQRPRLVERIERGTRSRVTVVSAPPGFGKTTLLAEWLHQSAGSNRQLAWLSLDANDNHAPTFWTYALSALERARPALAESGAVELLESSQPPPIETLLVTALNHLAADGTDLVLVLDDYHVIDSAAVHEALAFLIENMPPHMHVLIASRSDPVLPLARLRARGELTEVRAADLRFTAGETSAFLNDAMGLELAPGDVAALASRTEGWIAALQLAAISIQGREDRDRFINSFAGDDRYIVDYLVEEVLGRQPEPVRQFLLVTSVLEGLTAALCDALTGNDDGKTMLERLERSNLFLVPLDDKRHWFRYHHLFAEVLRAHLAEEFPGLVPELHRRASAWYAGEGESAHAVRHALAANDLPRAAALIEAEAETIVRAHRPDRLVEWVKPIPPDLIREMPVLSTYLALARQGLGDLEGSASHLDDAERWLNRPADSNTRSLDANPGFSSLPSRIALARGYLASAAGDTRATVEEARRALELLEPDEHHWHGTASGLLSVAHWRNGELDAAQPVHIEGLSRFELTGDTGLAITSGYHDAELMKARGRLTEAKARYEQSLEYAIRHGSAAMRFAANLHLGLSELFCERGDLPGAASHLQQAETLGIHPPRTPYRHRLAVANLRECQGDFAGAIVLLEEALQQRIRGAVPDVRPIESWRARLWIRQGKAPEALAWTDRQGLSVDDTLSYEREHEHITLARTLIALARSGHDGGSFEEAERLLQRLQAAAQGGGRVGALIEVLVLRAVAALSAQGGSAGLQHLERALALAEPEGYVRVFIAEGEPMRELLRRLVAEGRGGADARRLLTFLESPRGAGVSPAASPNGLTEQLTVRELEILRLVSAGLRNQEIADHLVISLPTVKRHIANTYGKLGVGHRTGALARASELGLLESH